MRVTELPSLTAETILSMSGMLATASSTRRVTSVSICDGVAPGRVIVIWTVGSAMSGSCAIGSWRSPYNPAMHSTTKVSAAGSGLRIPQSDRFMAQLPATTLTRSPSPRKPAPRTTTLSSAATPLRISTCAPVDWPTSMRRCATRDSLPITNT